MTEDPPERGEILICDDNPIHLDLLAQLLRGNRYRVRAVTDGERALRTASHAAPDLMMLDVNMPGMDGFEVCRRLKQDASLRRIPVLFVSAADDVLDIVAAFEVGAADYVTKPFQFPEVLGRVQVQLERALLERRLERAEARVKELEGLLEAAKQAPPADGT